MIDECSQHSFALEMLTLMLSSLKQHRSYLSFSSKLSLFTPCARPSFALQCFRLLYLLLLKHWSLPLGGRGVGGQTQSLFCSLMNSQSLAYRGTPEAIHLYLPSAVQTLSRKTFSATVCGKLQCPLKNKHGYSQERSQSLDDLESKSIQCQAHRLTPSSPHLTSSGSSMFKHILQETPQCVFSLREVK